MRGLADFTMPCKFQVVPPCGGHPELIAHFINELSFKSCPRVGGIKVSAVPSQSGTLFQVVPPCGGHRSVISEEQEKQLVSSRAPVWGASMEEQVAEALLDEFQVVPPCGGHRVASHVDLFFRPVSSRAPVWGASLYASL